MATAAALAAPPIALPPAIPKAAAIPQAVPATSSSETIRIQLTTPNDAKLASPMAGKIVALPFRDGDKVKKGDVLVQFLCNERDARLAEAKAHVKQATARLNGTLQLDRLGSASKVDLEVQKAELAATQADESLTQAQADACRIKAPFDGRLANVVVKAFATVQEGQPLFDVVGGAPLEIAMIVPSRWLSWLKPGYAFTIYVDETGKIYTSTITRIGGTIDPVTQSVPVYGKLAEDAPDLMAGMSGSAALSPPAGQKP